MLKLKKLRAGYGKTEVLHGINLEINRGELVSIIGPNGSGKSTLLKTSTGILTQAAGVITLDGETTEKMSPRDMAQKVAYLAQWKSAPEMTVSEMVLHGRFPHLSYPRRYGAKDKLIALEAMKRMRICDLSDKPMSSLSGGMRQKAYIAMALAQETDLILLDEPTTYLDISNGISLMQTLRELSLEDKGIVAVMHDLPLAMTYSDRVIVMDKGEIVASGTPREIYESDVIYKIFGVAMQKDKENYYYKQR